MELAINKSKKETQLLLRQAIAISFLSGSLLLYEFILTRFFSAVLITNLVFMAVSAIIFGLSVGQALYAYFGRQAGSVRWVILGMAVTEAIILISFYRLPYIPGVIVYPMVAALPFVAGGWIMAALYADRPDRAGVLYAFDLLGGAVSGGLYILLFEVLGYFGSGMLSVGLALLAGGVLWDRSQRRKVFMFTACIILIFMLLLDTIQSMDFQALYTSPYKAYAYLELTPEARLSQGRWTVMGRMDTVEMPSGQERIVFTDGGASAPIMKSVNGQMPSLLHKEPGMIAHMINDDETVLLIGSGGGRDIWMAQAAGANQIDAVEINPATVEAVRSMPAFSGNVYDRENVSVFTMDGRQFVEQTETDYDHINLSMVMTNAVSSGMASLSENYVLTKEAFSAYYERLKPSGRVSVMAHDGREMLRVMNTWSAELMYQGVAENALHKYMVVVNGMTLSHGERVHMPIVLLYKSPVQSGEMRRIQEEVFGRNLPFIHTPEHPLWTFQSLLDGTGTLEDLYELEDLKVAPPTDDRPYFYNFGTGTLKTLLTSIFALGIVIGMLMLSGRKHISKMGALKMAGSGIAFILVEIALIQLASRVFGSTVLGFSIPVIVLLLAGGAGSIRQRKRRDISIYQILLLSGWVLLMPTALSWLYQLHASMEIRILIVVMLLIPIGFWAGKFYPTTLQRYGKKPRGTALLLTVNGVATVFGSIAALVIGQTTGTSAVLLVGASVYAGLAVLWRRRVA